MSQTIISSLSRHYGADARFVLAGGGNTSCKDAETLYVKPSGISLANITEKDFVAMSRQKLREIFNFTPPTDTAAREAAVKEMMAASVAPGSTGRPSVEAPLHELIKYTYVVHLHPALVNGMTCGHDGKKHCAKLFPDALWVDYVDPGFTLARQVGEDLAKHEKLTGRQPHIIFLQNHGVFVGADTEREIHAIYSQIMDTLTAHYKKAGVSIELSSAGPENSVVQDIAPRLRSLLGNDSQRAVVVCAGLFSEARGPLTPDHIVYAKSYALSSLSPDASAIGAFEAEKGYRPLVLSVPGKAVFCAGANLKDARNTAALARDAGLVQQLTAAFGGPEYLDDRQRGFIENWEVESYRKKVSSSANAAGRLHGRIAVVTGGAQGFGYGIAEGLLSQGATVAIADLNLAGAGKAASELCSKFGADRAFALEVNIADEDSVAAMSSELVRLCGGVDLFVANAGVLKAGSVKTMARKDWNFVTDVNYTGYFLCVKHISTVMAKQNMAGGDWSDIVQINSKSGLAGSNRNGAYAGSKFGTIGLTQSFAMELIEDRIKVNSICPGNFFDGPLWSDPVNGLFVQYLKSGKVPGAKTIDDVRKSYESKVPMNRGCLPQDVVTAILYAVEQKYETGQAIPVTGGQIMLN